MSREQPPSFPHYRSLAQELGYPRALKAASHEVDRVLEELGNKTDKHLTLLFGGVLCGFLCGLLVAVVLGIF
jgi:hypothetical protein